MKYICYKNFNGRAICGETLTINVGASCSYENHIIKYQNKDICVNTSENAHKYFMRNDDGQGMVRGQLIDNITNLLATQDNKYDKRWEAVWNDPICQAYKRPEHTDFWLWNHAFYNTTVDTLTYIYNLIREVG